MEKKIEDYLHLYYNADCRTPYGAWKDKFLKPKVHTALYFKEKDVKLCLRPLSDITNQELHSLFQLAFKTNDPFDEFVFNSVEHFWSAKRLRDGFVETCGLNLDHTNPECFKMLLSMAFDLFGLIECGLAIDTTNMPV